MIGCLYEAKVVFQGGNVSQQPLGVDSAVEDLDGDSALLARPLYLIDGELHLEDKVEFTAHENRANSFSLWGLVNCHFNKASLSQCELVWFSVPCLLPVAG